MKRISNFYTGILVATYLVLVVLQRRTPVDISIEVMKPTHYRQADVQVGISMFPPKENLVKPKIRGGVVPHHLLAEVHIARYFQNLSQFTYNQVILIGPNHGELGVHDFVTSDLAWETPYGNVQPVAKLSGLPVDNEVMRSDHALEVIMPFIKVYLPKAQVLPILVKGAASQTKIDNLVSELLPLVTSNTLILVSTDFSHYLRSDEAHINDQITLGLIKIRDYGKLALLGNGYIDSPNSIIILLKLLDKLDVSSLQVYDHSDGSAIAGTPTRATTSYYFLNYYEAQ